MKTDLSRRKVPSQKRAQKTIETILEATGALLDEVGFENLSTNLVCKRAGLTPPAVYRYFPNKHAIMCELGERLMEKQNEAMLGIFDTFAETGDIVGTIRRVMEAQIEVTEKMPGGNWITKSLYASPSLCEVRTQSHEMVTEELLAVATETFKIDPSDGFRRSIRLMIEVGYSVIEFLLDIPKKQRGKYLDETAELLAFSLSRNLS